MTKKELVKLIRQWCEEMQRLLDFMPEHKREEVDIAEFMDAREKRIRERRKDRPD